MDTATSGGWIARHLERWKIAQKMSCWFFDPPIAISGGAIGRRKQVLRGKSMQAPPTFTFVSMDWDMGSLPNINTEFFRQLRKN